jgi:hypothetical protein
MNKDSGKRVRFHGIEDDFFSSGKALCEDLPSKNVSEKLNERSILHRLPNSSRSVSFDSSISPALSTLNNSISLPKISVNVKIVSSTKKELLIQLPHSLEPKCLTPALQITVLQCFKIGKKACRNPAKIIHFYKDFFEYELLFSEQMKEEIKFKIHYKDMKSPVFCDASNSFRFQIQASLLSLILNKPLVLSSSQEYYEICMVFISRTTATQFRRYIWATIFYLATV